MSVTRSAQPGDVLDSDDLGYGISFRIVLGQPCFESGEVKLRLEIQLSLDTLKFLQSNGGAKLGVLGRSTLSLYSSNNFYLDDEYFAYSFGPDVATRVFLTRNIPKSLKALRVRAKKEVRKILKFLRRCDANSKKVQQIYASCQVPAFSASSSSVDQSFPSVSFRNK